MQPKPYPTHCDGCGKSIMTDEAIGQWVTSPLGISFVRGCDDVCVEFALEARNGRRRDPPPTSKL